VLARALLLGACTLGLAGLAAPAHHTASPATQQVSAEAAMATTIEIEPRAPHTLAATSVVAQRASRSRTVTPAKRRVPVRRTDRWVAPSGAGVISPFGMRWGRPHKGLDFGAHYGAPIYAIGDGVVVGTGYQSGESGYGQITIVRHRNGYYSAYAHQSSYLVHVGERVTAGEVIGYVGSTGNVTGPHLHFEIRTVEHGGQVNPRPWLRAHGVFV
jgi:murein DD-endopeptidase MepM/ murein hydrolase activator NlpD